MRRDIVRNLPTPEDNPPYHIGIVPNAWLPNVLAAIEVRKGYWLYETTEQAKIAFAVLSEVQLSFLTDAYNGLVEPQNRLYRWLETNVNGVVYDSEVLAGEIVITPPIDTVPAVITPTLRDAVQGIYDVLNDGINGSASYVPDGSVQGMRAYLSDIKFLLEAEDIDTDAIVANLGEILLLLA